jgi:N6-adenosine-specific RNA methylase IME4/transcriptional regulator with XRE-family HTH domain
LLDGHNRYEICTRLGLQFEVVEASGVETRDDAKLWIVRNQLGRRNISDFVRAELALVAKPLIEARAKANQKGGQGGVLLSQNLAEAIDTRAELAALAGVSHTNISKVERIKESAAPELLDAVRAGDVSINTAADIATLPPEKQAKVVEDGSALTVAKEVRAQKAEQRLAERVADINRQAAEIACSTPRAPAGLFHVISIDPPWPYGTEYDPIGRRAANPYPEMSLEQIAALSIPAADDCVLWLWTTHKFMRDAYALLDGWGFRDVAILTWAKDRIGLGSWLRSQSEFCVMAVKGSPVVTLTNQSTVLHGPLREHSRKPDEFYELVESLCVGRKLDFFSREPREGWEQFGNDLERFVA